MVAGTGRGEQVCIWVVFPYVYMRFVLGNEAGETSKDHIMLKGLKDLDRH